MPDDVITRAECQRQIADALAEGHRQGRAAGLREALEKVKTAVAITDEWDPVGPALLGLAAALQRLVDEG